MHIATPVKISTRAASREARRGAEDAEHPTGARGPAAPGRGARRGPAGCVLLATLLLQPACSLWRDEPLYDFAKEQAAGRQREDTLYLELGDQSARPYLIRGWSEDERDKIGRSFVWATGTMAELSFETIAPQDKELAIICRPIEDDRTQTMQVIVNGEALGAPLELRKDFGDYRVFIPARVQKPGRNLMRFGFAFDARPGAPGESRELAVCFDSMHFAPYDLLERELRPGRAGLPAFVNEQAAEGHQTIVMRIPSEKTFGLVVPEHARLSFRCGFAPEDWKTIEGGEFSVTIQADGGKPELLFSQFADPRKRRSHKKLFKESFNLDAYAGKTVRITFAVKAGYEKVSYPSYGIWIDPMISRRYYAWQTKPVEAAAQPDGKLDAMRSKLRDKNLLVMLLDAAAPSHFGCYGYDRPTTPNIDRLAALGLRFENAYCQAVYTRASTGSLLTGQYPDVHRVVYAADRLSEDAYTIAEMFTAAGYKTAGFIGNPHAGENAGYKQGFEHFLEMFKSPGYGNNAAEFLPQVRQWLERRGKEKWFAYVHFREPHFITDPPREYLDRFSTGYKGKINPQTDLSAISAGKIAMDDGALDHIRSVYDATLNSGDEAVGMILSELDRLGLDENTVVVVLSDHGEALWEHSYFGHNIHVYENMARIPLIVRLPAGIAQPGAVGSRVQSIDLFATFADLLGSADGRKHAAGRSILPELAGQHASDARFVYTRTIPGRATIGVRHERWEYVYKSKTDEEELYELGADRHESTNVAADHPAVVAFLHSKMLVWMRDQQARAAAYGAAPAQATIDEETRRSLQALGYLQGAGDQN